MPSEQAIPEANEISAETSLMPNRPGTGSSRRKVIMILASILLFAMLVIAFISFRKSANKPDTAVKPSASNPSQKPAVTVAYVTSKEVDRQLRLPGELRAYQDVALYPKVQSFVDWINVDRGSTVKHGQLLIRMSAPELISRSNEAEARVNASRQQ